MNVEDDSAVQRSRLRFKRMRDYAEAIVQTVRDPLVVLDKDLRIKSVNEAFCKTFKLESAKIRGRLIYSLGDVKWKFNRLRPLLKELLAQNTSTPHCEVNSYFTGKGHKTMLLNARKIKGLGASKSLILLAIEDISLRKHAQRRLEKLIESFKQDALTDPLTGLYNRRGFLTLGAQLLNIGRRMGKGTFVLFADVDALKQINDQGGHAEGDRVLIKTSNILKKTFRKSDIMARIGGDEFAIVTIEHLPGTIATLMARLKRHSAVTNGDTPISFSVGVAHSKATDLSSIEELVEKADAAMYIDKQHKKKSRAALHLSPVAA
jgi:diguanylate cyclase (GGDEF)-like protein/PAS domain S-box-containing protein